MHRANNVVIMQTEQLGRIEALEEELRSSRTKMVELEQKTTEQDRVIAQLVGDNLEHLCHHYDFLVRLHGTDLIFSNFLSFYLGLITTPMFSMFT